MGAPASAAHPPQQPGGAPRGLRGDPAAAARGAGAGAAAAAHRARPRPGARRRVQGQVSVPQIPRVPSCLPRPLHSPPIPPCIPPLGLQPLLPPPGPRLQPPGRIQGRVCPRVFPHTALCPHPFLTPMSLHPCVPLSPWPSMSPPCLSIFSCPHIPGPGSLYAPLPCPFVPLSPPPHVLPSPCVPISSCPHVPMSPILISLPVSMSPYTHVPLVTMSPSLLSPYPRPHVPRSHSHVTPFPCPTSPQFPSPYSSCPHVPHPRFSMCPCHPHLCVPLPRYEEEINHRTEKENEFVLLKKVGGPRH